MIENAEEAQSVMFTSSVVRSLRHSNTPPNVTVALIPHQCISSHLRSLLTEARRE